MVLGKFWPVLCEKNRNNFQILRNITKFLRIKSWKSKIHFFGIEVRNEYVKNGRGIHTKNINSLFPQKISSRACWDV